MNWTRPLKPRTKPRRAQRKRTLRPRVWHAIASTGADPAAEWADPAVDRQVVGAAEDLRADRPGRLWEHLLQADRADHLLEVRRTSRTEAKAPQRNHFAWP